MQLDYFNRLDGVVRSLVEEIEARIGFEITVKLDSASQLPKSSEPRGLRCEVDQYKAEIASASVDYFPDSSVFHELLHIRRFLVDGIPKLTVCEDYEPWTPRLESAILHLDNSLEHLVIIPIELRQFPDRRAYWEKRFEAQTRRLFTGELSETDRRWMASLVSVSVEHLGLGREAREAADIVVQRFGAKSLTRVYQEALAATISSKEHLARATFDCFELPLVATCLEYINTSYGSTQYVPLKEILSSLRS